MYYLITFYDCQLCFFLFFFFFFSSRRRHTRLQGDWSSDVCSSDLYSPLLLAPIGVSVPVYPVKGYSVTLPLEPGDEAPRTSLTDHARKIVISRLGDRLRVAGTAELNGYDTEVNEPRCAALGKACFDW